MPTRIRALPDPCGVDGTETAQRFLTSAHESVQAVLTTLDTVRDVRRNQGQNVTGRLTSQEEDLLRAAVVFTGAGLDSTLKRLIRDTLPRLLETNEQAHKKFEAFTVQRLGTAEIADTRMVARYLVAENPRAQLIDDYIYDLTGSSLQSAEQVQSTAGALGIDDGELRQQINTLVPLFTARNQVSHELDLQQPERPGDRTRRTRRMAATVTLCGDGFVVAQRVVNGVGNLLDT